MAGNQASSLHEDSPPELQPDRWTTNYTLMATIAKDASVEEGDVFTLPTRDIQITTWRDKLRVWLDKLTTPANEYYNIHLQNDAVNMKVICTSGNRCVLECVGTLKFYGDTSIGARVRSRP